MILSAHRFIGFNCRSVSMLGIILAGFMLNGCELAQNHAKIDREKHLEFQDYRDAFAPRDEEDLMQEQDFSQIPELQGYVMQPSDNLRSMPGRCSAIGRPVCTEGLL